MGKKPSVLKPSLQRIKDILDPLREETKQMESLLKHLQIVPRFTITEEYVFNMVDSVLELLRQYLQEELNSMLRGGKNESNRQYIRVRNELNVVLAEQESRSAKQDELKELAKAA